MLILIYIINFKIYAQDIKERNFLAYYRIWRDKKVKQDNTNLTGENWMSMKDIPSGVNIVNVFGYNPDLSADANKKYEEYLETLKKEYVPHLHKNGVKVVFGINYKKIIDVPRKNKDVDPTDEEIKEYAKKIVEEHVKKYGLDGLDIDMEMTYKENPTNPSNPDQLTKKKVEIGNKMIKALSEYLGPKAKNGTLLIYDTNNLGKEAVKDLNGYFDKIAYQQYGKTKSQYTEGERHITKKALENFKDIFSKENFMPGLTFPEENAGKNNQFTDFHINDYKRSNFYKLADYVNKNDLGGMFIYALDRDSRTYTSADLKTLVRSNFIWTKTAIQEANGWSLEKSREVAKHNLKRIKYSRSSQLTEEKIKEIEQKLDAATNLFDINKYILGFFTDGTQMEKSVNEDYDPTLEKKLMNIDISKAMYLLDKFKNNKYGELKQSYENLSTILGGKRYDKKQIEDGINGISYSIFNKIETDLIKDGALSAIKFTHHNELTDKINIGYTLIKQGNKFFHNINAGSLVYKNFGLRGNIAFTTKDVNLLFETYYNLYAKIGKNISGLGVVYSLTNSNLEDIKVKTDYVALRVDNNFKFNGWSGYGFSISPDINVNLELGTYKLKLVDEEGIASANKFIYNHRISLGLELGYVYKKLSIGAKVYGYNTVTLTQKQKEYNFGVSAIGKIGYIIDDKSSINIKAGYSTQDVLRVGLEYNREF
ncbi:EndoS/ChiA family endoglycosidase [Caviibacter abscessus]|nr:hypothetical protein [Caviibacter abscessus]